MGCRISAVLRRRTWRSLLPFSEQQHLFPFHVYMLTTRLIFPSLPWLYLSAFTSVYTAPVLPASHQIYAPRTYFTMPCFRGIELSIVEASENSVFPEFPHPDGSSVRFVGLQSSRYSSAVFLSPRRHSKADGHLSDDGQRHADPKVSVYIPSAPGRWCLCFLQQTHLHKLPPAFANSALPKTQTFIFAMLLPRRRSGTSTCSFESRSMVAKWFPGASILPRRW